MDFRVLGPVEAGADGRSVALGGRRQRMLLALLLLYANEAVSSERLIDSLWPGRRPQSAANALQQYVSRLRKALGEQVLGTTTAGYVLRVSPGELDVWRFESLLSEMPGTNPVRAVKAAFELRAALSGLEVEARIGVSTGEVVTDARQLRVVGQAASRAAELGRAAEPGEVLIAETTLSLISDKVAVESIEIGEHRPAAWRLLSLVVRAPAVASAFVGRRAELATLVGTWERVRREQRCDLLTVIGVPGVGKSRLVAES
jgi:hypothetical protein